MLQTVKWTEPQDESWRAYSGAVTALATSCDTTLKLWLTEKAAGVFSFPRSAWECILRRSCVAYTAHGHATEDCLLNKHYTIAPLLHWAQSALGYTPTQSVGASYASYGRGM